MNEKDEWRSVLREHGAPSVMVHGIAETQMLSVVSLGSQRLVRCFNLLMSFIQVFNFYFCIYRSYSISKLLFWLWKWSYLVRLGSL